jgi:hypothetical protein
MDSEIRVSRVLKACFGVRRKLAGLLREPALGRGFLEPRVVALRSVWQLLSLDTPSTSDAHPGRLMCSRGLSGLQCVRTSICRGDGLPHACRRWPDHLRNGSCGWFAATEPPGRARSPRWDLCGRVDTRHSCAASFSGMVSVDFAASASESVDTERDPGCCSDGWRTGPETVRRTRSTGD